MKYYCPSVNSICEDGYPNLKDDQCVMWDEEKGVCLIRESAKGSVESLQMQRQVLGQAKLPKDEKVNKLLSSVNLEGK